jgi:TetR/AcrR family tetracycline transcriptional repressor
VDAVADRSARVNRAGPRWLDRHEDEKPVRIPLTLRRIVDAALALVDDEGLQALTIRRLATMLRVAPMSLYSHVTDKAELVDVMVDVVIGEVIDGDDHADPGADGDWSEELRALSLRYHAAWAGHRGLVRVYADGVTLGPNGTAMTERFLGILRSAGFDDAEAVQAFWLLYHYTIGSLQIAAARPTPGKLRRGGNAGDSTLSLFFSAVPLEEIPHITAVVDVLAAGGHYEFGLDTIIAGLKARRDRRPVAAGPGASRGAPDGLTVREAQLLALVGRGRSDEAIAAELGVTARTVKRHVSSLLAKLGAPDREALRAVSSTGTGAVGTARR